MKGAPSFARLGKLVVALVVASLGQALWCADAVANPTNKQDAASPLLNIIDAADPTAVVYQSKAKEFKRRLVLKFGDEKLISPYEVSVGHVEDSSGQLHPATLAREGEAASAKVKVTERTELPAYIVLAAETPAPGDYFGVLTFKIGDKEPYRYQSKTFRIARSSLEEVPLRVSEPRQTSGVDADTLVFSLSTTGGDVTTRPVSFGLTQKTPGKPVSYDKVVVSSGECREKCGVTVVKGSELELVANIRGLSPGEYNAKLAFEAEGYARKEVSFAFAARHGWLIAFITIVAGASLSLLAKRLSTRLRPRLVVRSAVAKLVLQADNLAQHFNLDAAEAAVLSAIRTRLKGIEASANEPDDPPPGWALSQRQALAAEGAKLEAYPNWVNARRLVQSLVGLDEATKTRFWTTLDSSGRALADTPALTSLNAGSVLDVLNEATGRKKVQASAAVDAVSQAIFDATADSDDKNARASLALAHDHAGAARSALQIDDLVGYELAYGSAGLELFRGMSMQRLSQLDAASASDGNYDGPRAAPKDDRSEVGRSLLSALLDARTMVDAQRLFYEAIEALHSSDDGPVGTLGRGAPAERLLVSTPRLLLPGVVNTASDDTIDLDRAVKQIDLWLDVAVIGCSGLLGLLLIWWPNNAWGQVYDFIAAFLWGAGLFTVGTSTFEGVLSVRSRLAP